MKRELADGRTGAGWAGQGEGLGEPPLAEVVLPIGRSPEESVRGVRTDFRNRKIRRILVERQESIYRIDGTTLILAFPEEENPNEMAYEVGDTLSVERGGVRITLHRVPDDS